MIDSKKFWDGMADKYAKLPIKDIESYEYTLGRTRRYLEETFNVLEVGCGTGSTALELADNVKHIMAADISDEMIEIAKVKAQQNGTLNVSFAQCDLGHGLPGQRPFDVILAFNLLHLLPNAENVVADIASRLEKGGIFISKTPCLAGYVWKYLPFIKLLQLFGKAPFVRILSVKAVEKMIEDAGFDILEKGDFPYSPPCRYIVAVKTA